MNALLVPAHALDRARASLLSWTGRPLAPIFRDRELRVAWVGSLSVLVSLALTIVAPGLLLAWGPILLGVPHLLADGRYLVVRRGLLARPWVLALVIGPAALTLLGGSATMGALAIVGAGLATRAPLRTRTMIVVLGLSLAWVAHRLGRTADLALAHLHNLVAIGLWLAWRPRRARLHWAVVSTFVFGCALLSSGALDRVAFDALLSSPGVNELIAQLGIGPDPTWAVRSVLLFAFAQSVHYGVWLRLVPDEDREREAPRPFVRTFEALARDVSWPVLALVCALTLGFVVYGVLDSVAARDGYLRLAAFHGPMELGLASLLFAERRTA